MSESPSVAIRLESASAIALIAAKPGSSFAFFAICPADQFETKRETAGYSGYRFCPECGSRVFAPAAHGVSVKLGTLTDAPTNSAPEFEIWTKRRDSWLHAVDGAQQFE